MKAVEDALIGKLGFRIKNVSPEFPRTLGESAKDEHEIYQADVTIEVFDVVPPEKPKEPACTYCGGSFEGAFVGAGVDHNGDQRRAHRRCYDIWTEAIKKS